MKLDDSKEGIPTKKLELDLDFNSNQFLFMQPATIENKSILS